MSRSRRVVGASRLARSTTRRKLRGVPDDSSKPAQAIAPLVDRQRRRRAALGDAPIELDRGRAITGDVGDAPRAGRRLASSSLNDVRVIGCRDVPDQRALGRVLVDAPGVGVARRESPNRRLGAPVQLRAGARERGHRRKRSVDLLERRTPSGSREPACSSGAPPSRRCVGDAVVRLAVSAGVGARLAQATTSEQPRRRWPRRSRRGPLEHGDRRIGRRLPDDHVGVVVADLPHGQRTVGVRARPALVALRRIVVVDRRVARA